LGDKCTGVWSGLRTNELNEVLEHDLGCVKHDLEFRPTRETDD
jgi:hypothetical protein